MQRRRAATRTACSCSTIEKGSHSALGEVEEEIQLPSLLHFGKDAATPDDVHALGERLNRDRVPIVGRREEPDYVSVEFRDPDGYCVELAWEPT